MSQFGFTNDPEKIKMVRTFRDAAVNDGWSIRPTYPNHESVDRSATMNREGYTMMILTRDPASGPKWLYEAQISIWGPDGLAITPPDGYDFAEIEKGLRFCYDCNQYVERTVRVGFAGRVCPACLPAARLRDEKPGWCD